MSEFKINLPLSINDIKLGDYQKYIKVYEANKDVDDANFLELKLLEILCDVDLAVANQMPFEAFDDTLEYMSDIFKEKTPLTRRFKMKGTDGVVVDFGFIPNLSKMSLGEYVDLDTYISDMENMHKAMAVLYRPVHKSWDGKEHYRVMEYQGTEKFAEVMKEMPLGIALGAMVLSFRDEIVEAYDGLFSTTSGEGGVIGGAEAAFGERYGWYQSLYALAGGDALRLTDATSLPLHEALTWLQFEKEKNKLESDRIKKAYKK